MAKAKKKTAKKPAAKKPPAKKAAPKKKKAAPKQAAPSKKQAAPSKKQAAPSKPAASKKQAAPRKQAAPNPPPAAPEPAREDVALDSTESLFADLADDLDAVAAAFAPVDVIAGDNTAQNAVHVELGAKLSSARGDEAQERAAFASAIDAFMRIHIERGAPPETSPADYLCAEFFWEGDAQNPPVYGRVSEATHEEISRWFKLLVEETRTYELRVQSPV